MTALLYYALVGAKERRLIDEPGGSQERLEYR